jgi:hypothetical protein
MGIKRLTRFGRGKRDQKCANQQGFVDKVAQAAAHSFWYGETSHGQVTRLGLSPPAPCD